MIHRIVAVLAGLALSSPTLAQATAPGIEMRGYAWNAPNIDVTELIHRPVDLARGKDAYRICRGCHGADGARRGAEGYPQLAGQHRKVLIKQLLDIRAGRRDSPKMQPFVDPEVVRLEEIGDIAGYLAQLPPPRDNVKGSGKALKRGERLYARDCAACHGARGEGVADRFYPSVAGQHYPYLYAQTLESRNLGRRNGNPEMVRVLKNYSLADIAAVSDYMSRLPASPHAEH